MVNQIGIRQLRADLAAVIRQAGAGDHLIVTVGGHPVATLGPLGTGMSQLGIADLEGLGLIIAPRRTDVWATQSPISLWPRSNPWRLLRETR